MHSRWYVIAVVLLWLGSMTWLVKEQMVGAFIRGEPPNYETILEAQEDRPPVGWLMQWNGRPLGWAISGTTPLENGLTEYRSRVHFREVPLSDVTPRWMRSVVDPIEQLGSQLSMEVNSILVFDALGRLSRFDSFLGFGGMDDDLIKVHGSIDNGKLTVSMHTGDFTYDTETEFRDDAMMADAFSPQVALPGLRQGQSWTVDVYGPLRPPNTPVEVLQATVEGIEPILWNGRMVDTWLVVYRGAPGSGSSRAKRDRARLWVARDGTVLQQQADILGSTLTFTRMPERHAAELAAGVDLWEDRYKPSPHLDSL
jgi:hypothetical protein